MDNYIGKHGSIFNSSIVFFSVILLLAIFSCKPTGSIEEVKIENDRKQVTDTSSSPKIEMFVGQDIKVETPELKDFNEFMVWVTTRKMDTIGNCKLKKVPNIKGLDTLPHFFVKFQTLPIVYKMKIANRELVFAKINRSGTN